MHKKPHQKRLIIHLGPHKTGSTSIQRWLQRNSKVLEASKVHFLHNEKTHKAATLIAREEYDAAEEILEDISFEVRSDHFKTFILSQEDFSGHLPGKTKHRPVYGKLRKNVRILSRAFSDFETSFIFFVREETDWLRSCYHQNLRYRTRFSTFQEFLESVDLPVNWQSKLLSVQSATTSPILTIDYQPDPKHGIEALLEVAGLRVDLKKHPIEVLNRSPAHLAVESLERINARSAFPATAWFSKALVLDRLTARDGGDLREKKEVSGEAARIALPELLIRSEGRFPKQDADDILPDVDVDLHRYAADIIPAGAPPATLFRGDIRHQAKILEHQLQGKSKLLWLNALIISYLRRDTPLTAKAKFLFHRVWNEFGPHLLNEMSTRWLISTLQTFLDHGENEAQRLIGAAGFFYANMIKIYEGERSLDALEQGAETKFLQPQTKSMFRGLDRYRVGGTDLLLNTNAIALDVARRDDVAGIVLIEFLLRVKSSGNVFTRADRTRKLNNIDIPGFEDTWSFFVKPQ